MLTHSPKSKQHFIAFYEGCCKVENVGQFQSLKGKGLAFLVFLWFIWFMNFSVRTIFSPIMPLIEDEFAVSHATATSLFFYTSTGCGITLFLSGLFSGCIGYRRSIYLSIIIAAIGLDPDTFCAHFHSSHHPCFGAGPDERGLYSGHHSHDNPLL